MAETKKDGEKVIKAYKGFDGNLCCRGFQYEVGKEYEMDGEIECCERGFHACKNPLEVLDYYYLLDDCKMARFCEVEQSGTTHTEDNGSTKVASSKIKIKAELKFADLIKLSIDWIKEKVKSTNDDKVQAASGDYSQLAASGDYSKLAASGYSSQLATSGDYSQLAASGYYSQLAASGYSSQLAASGYSSKLAASGYSSKLAASGYSSQLAASGDYSKVTSTGQDSVICCAGHNCVASAKKGSWITLAEWVYDKDKGRFIPKCVKTEQVDGERIKEDTPYKLIDGEFVEVK